MRRFQRSSPFCHSRSRKILGFQPVLLRQLPFFPFSEKLNFFLVLHLEIMKIIKEKDDYDPDDIVLIEYLTYYILEFLTNDWILKTLYISKPQISLQESMTIIQLNLPQEIKEEILIKAKIENLRTKIYLMVITLDLNLVNNNIQEAYDQEEDLNEIFYYNLNKMEIPNIENIKDN